LGERKDLWSSKFGELWGSPNQTDVFLAGLLRNFSMLMTLEEGGEYIKPLFTPDFYLTSCFSLSLEISHETSVFKNLL